jgi:hypothetical protein
MLSLFNQLLEKTHEQIEIHRKKLRDLLLAFGGRLPTICFPAPKCFDANAQFGRESLPRFPGFQPEFLDLLSNRRWGIGR